MASNRKSQKYDPPGAPRRVVVALRMAGIAGQDKLNGIFNFLSEGRRWQLIIYRTKHEFTAEVNSDDAFIGIFCGSMYIKDKNRCTDFFVKNFCERFNYFSPPYDTFESLQQRFKRMYTNVKLTNIESFAGFTCIK